MSESDSDFGQSSNIFWTVFGQASGYSKFHPLVDDNEFMEHNSVNDIA